MNKTKQKQKQKNKQQPNTQNLLGKTTTTTTKTQCINRQTQAPFYIERKPWNLVWQHNSSPNTTAFIMDNEYAPFALLEKTCHFSLYMFINAYFFFLSSGSLRVKQIYDGGGGFSLAREDFGGMFNHSFSACAFFVLFLFFWSWD